MKTTIEKITGYEILNGKGKPTVEAVLTTSDGMTVHASTPSGASKGKYEAVELYDGGERYRGFGTRKAAANLSGEINNALRGMDVTDQRAIDRVLCELDGTSRKERLGSNAVLAASMAAAKAGAATLRLPTYRFLGGFSPRRIPCVSSTVISGGAFSPSGLEFEDYLLILDGFPTYADSVEALCRIRYELEKAVHSKVGICPEDAGALAPALESTEETFDTILGAVRAAGCEQYASLGLDVAANEMYDEATGTYLLSKYQRRYTPDELLNYYEKLCKDYPLTYIEDAFQEDQFDDFARLTKALPGVKISGDDLFATNAKRLSLGIEKKAANTLLFKLNQIGTVTEAFQTAMLAIDNGFSITASCRSGESLEDFYCDLAVAIGAEQMKMGSPVRGERNAKFNRLLRIETELFG